MLDRHPLMCLPNYDTGQITGKISFFIFSFTSQYLLLARKTNIFNTSTMYLWCTNTNVEVHLRAKVWCISCRILPTAFFHVKSLHNFKIHLWSNTNCNFSLPDFILETFPKQMLFICSQDINMNSQFIHFLDLQHGCLVEGVKIKQAKTRKVFVTTVEKIPKMVSFVDHVLI